MKLEQSLDTIGSRLRYARNAKNFKVKKVQEQTGISIGNLSTLENDNSKPSSEALLLLSELYGVTTDWILKGGDPVQIKEEDSLYQFYGLTDVSNKELVFLVKMLLESWKSGDEETKGWIIVQLRRAFPEIAERANIMKEKKEF